MEYGRQHRWRSLEFRTVGQNWLDTSRSSVFWGHSIHLEKGQDALFNRLKSPVRSGIRKAEGEGLRVEFSTSAESMRVFYRLHCLTRQRHGIPCQSRRFFDNIARFMLAKGHGFVSLAWRASQPVAAAVFLHHGREAVYKFGASDYAFQRLRPNNLLLWESIKKCAADGLARLHLGRTSLHQEGLRRFKLGFGAAEEQVEYFKYDFRKQAFVTGVDYSTSRLTGVLRRMPVPVLRMLGQLVYPYFA